MAMAWKQGTVWLGLLSLATSAGPLGAQQRAGVAVELTGRAQVQFSTSSVDDDEAEAEVVGSSFETRRVRFGAEVTVDDWLFGKIEPEFAGGELRLADAYVALELHPAATLRVGHFKRPFSLLELTSSTRLLPIERGVRIRGLDELLEARAAGGPAGEHYEILSELGYVGRDVGASLAGRVGRFGYEAGVFNGRGTAGADDNDAKTFAGRLTLAPFAAPLVLGAAVAGIEGEVDAEQERGTAYGFDLEYGRYNAPGLHLLGEIAFGEHLGGAEEFLGAQGTAAWFFALESARLEGLELVGRASWGDPVRDLSDDEGLLLTPGINLYVQGRNRLMLNWDVYLPVASGIDTVHALRAQLALAF